MKEFNNDQGVQLDRLIVDVVKGKSELAEFAQGVPLREIVQQVLNERVPPFEFDEIEQMIEYLGDQGVLTVHCQKGQTAKNSSDASILFRAVDLDACAKELDIEDAIEGLGKYGFPNWNAKEEK